MTILLSHTTALEACRRSELRRRLERGERCAVPLLPEPAGAEELSRLVRADPLLADLPGPLDLLVRAGSSRVRNARVRTHQLGLPLPGGAAVELAPGVLCASPEELAVEMAPQLTDLELTLLLAELTGLYAIDPESEDGMLQCRRPLTSPERLRDYFDGLGRRPGARRVERALAHAPVRAGSPREAKLALRLSLRPGLGGYNLAVLSMNDPVGVRRINDAMGAGVRRPDIIVGPPDGAARSGGVPFVAVEYHGRRHDAPARLAQDAERTNELKAMGVSEYVIRREQYRDLDYMDGLVERMRRELGMSRVGLSAAEARRRRELRRELYEELERIDGTHWNGRERDRARRAADREGHASTGWDVVPVEAYGLG